MSPWTAPLRAPPAGLALVHELGGPDDPSSVFGRERLTVRPDGAVVLEWDQAGRSGAWDARVPPKLVARWAALLVKGGFPDLPTAPPGPGASARFFEAHLDDRHVRVPLPRFEYEDTPPFDELCALADGIVAAIRGRRSPHTPDPARGAVTGVRPR